MKNRKLIFPSIAEFHDFSSYLKHFFEMNREKKIPMSLAFLAKKLKWPESVLKDLYFGRRPLSMRRAFEFAEYADMDIWECERLCKMALKFPPAAPTPHVLCEQQPSKSPPCTSALVVVSSHELRVIRSKIFDIFRSLKKFEKQNQKSTQTKKFSLNISLHDLSAPVAVKKQTPPRKLSSDPLAAEPVVSALSV